MSTFRWFLLSYGLDRWADMLWVTTLAWLAASAPNPALAGLILAAAFIPHVAALLLGGAQADRLGPATVTRATSLAKVAVLAVLLVVHTVAGDSLLAVAVAAALLAVVDGFHDPAMETWGMHLRPPEEQHAAAAAEATVWRVAQSVGAALGGLLVGIGAVYALSATLGLLVIARLALIPLGPSAAPEAGRRAAGDTRQSPLQQMRAGLAFVGRHPLLPTTMTVQMTATLTSGALLMLLLPNLIRAQQWSGAVYGAAATAFGLGLIAGSSLVLRDQESTRRRITQPVRVGLLCAVLCNAPLAASAATESAPLVVAEIFVYGALLGPVGPLLSGYRRSQTPRSMSGVVAAAAKLVLIAPEPVGPLLAGLLATAAGLDVATYACAAVAVTVPAAGLMRSALAERQAREVGASE